jgi:hypothetical protein
MVERLLVAGWKMNTRTLASGLLFAALIMLAAPASAENRKIVVEGFSAPQRTMTLQLNFGGMSLSDDQVDPRGTAELGGGNLSFRWDIVRWGGLEIAGGGYDRLDETELVREKRNYGSLAWMWYLVRHRNHRLYGITGLASLNTTMQIGNSTYSYGEGGLMLGVGSDWGPSRGWIVSMDVRALMLNNQDQKGALKVDEPDVPEGLDRDPFPAEWYTPPEERVALMANFGIGYRW